jgi:hypothetical protein
MYRAWNEGTSGISREENIDVYFKEILRYGVEWVHLLAVASRLVICVNEQALPLFWTSAILSIPIIKDH